HGRRVAAAVASRRGARFPAVGVDVVDREDEPRIQKIASRVLTAHEKALIGVDPRVALHAWGTREAVAKATSTGMFMFALAGAPLVGIDAATGRITTDLDGVEVAYQDTPDGGVLVLAGASKEAIERAQAKAGLASK
ncbi:4'-phosphopantetheinyl transferase superfamily protein, partial [Myxococcota bacterium]|nr:4'-phosphopantetheinyl transferase superfamily protein [Myxococcota bacterium]